MNWLLHIVSIHLTPLAYRAWSALFLAVLAGPVGAANWNGEAAVNGTLTLTDNVFLSPSGQEQSDMYLGLYFPLSVRREGGRIKLQFDYTPAVYLYANSSGLNNLQNNLGSLLSVEVADNFFFVDAVANISQTFISPFLPRPQNGGSATDNRTQTINLGLSPYIKGVTNRGFAYSVRNDNFWTTYSGSGLSNNLISNIIVNIESPGTRVRYGFDYNYLYTKYESQPSAFYQQLARLRPTLAVTPTLVVSARIGYETNDYPLSESQGPIYGGGLDWAPTPRTKLSGFAEHRFFGLSYGVNFTHRTRLTAWTLTASRNTSTSTDQTLSLQPGPTQAVLDAALLTRVPDAVERQQAVSQLMRQAGLPPVLSSPYTFYTNQVYLANQAIASVALLGKRNTATLSLFYQDNEAITPSGTALPGVLVNFNNFRQRGGDLTLGHNLSAFSTVTFTAQRVYGLGTNPQTPALQAQEESIQNTFYLIFTRQFGAKTYGSLGARWVDFDSPISAYQEAAVFASLFHSF